MRLRLLFEGGDEKNIYFLHENAQRDIRIYEEKKFADKKLHQIIIEDKDIEPILITVR